MKERAKRLYVVEDLGGRIERDRDGNLLIDSNKVELADRASDALSTGLYQIVRYDRSSVPV